jgi:hypothetical protein
MGATVNNGQSLRIISGYINDLTIREIRIAFMDNTVTVLKTGQGQQTYTEYVLGKVSKVEKITAFNENNEVVYSYMW